jgi:hypothetical protein
VARWCTHAAALGVSSSSKIYSRSCSNQSDCAIWPEKDGSERSD